MPQSDLRHVFYTNEIYRCNSCIIFEIMLKRRHQSDKIKIILCKKLTGGTCEMRILFTNDDGVHSPGLLALLRAFRDGNELYVAAPDGERSGASHSFSMHVPLRAREVVLSGAADVPAYAISGTPADCVKLAFGNLFPKPDLLISGINLGANRGTDIFYSGTVAAAMEGALLGIPAVAVSDIAFRPQCFGAAVAGAKAAVQLLLKEKDCLLLNVNAPDIPESEVKGIKLTTAGIQEYEARYEERIDTHGQKYYWIPSGRTNAGGPEDDSDERWTNAGYVTVTPIVTNMTDYTLLAKLRAGQTNTITR